MKRLILLPILLSAFLNAQQVTQPAGPPPLSGAGAPVGACPGVGASYIDTTAHTFYFCGSDGGSWVGPVGASLVTPVSLGLGGTNNALTADNGAVPYSDASKIVLLAHNASAGIPLCSGGAGAPTWCTSATFSGLVNATGVEGSQYGMSLGGQAWKLNMVSAGAFYINDVTGAHTNLQIDPASALSLRIGTTSNAFVGAVTTTTTFGVATVPATSIFIGGAATNNIRLTGTSAAARVVTIPDVGTDTGATVVLSPTSTTTTQPLFATATAGLYGPRAIAAGDLPGTLSSGTAITNAALTTPTVTTWIKTPIVAPSADGTAALIFTKTDGSTIVGSVDTTNGRWLKGPGSAPDSPLEVRASTGAVATVAPTAGTNVHIVGTDATVNRIYMDSYGAANSIDFREANGTTGSKTASNTGVVVAQLGGRGFDGTNYSAAPVAIIQFIPTQTFTSSNQGTQILLKTTPNNSVTAATAVTIDQDQSLSVNGIKDVGTKFTISGCTAGTTVGGATAGSFASGTTGACTVVITMNGATGLTATNGWACHASNTTTPANLIDQKSPVSTTQATLSGTTVSGDVITFGCIGY